MNDEVQRLLDAGLAVMRRHGTDRSPSVAEIVAAAGLSNDAFYRAFPSKDELILAVLDAGAGRTRTYLSHQMGKHDDPADQIRAWVTGLMAQAGKQPVADETRAVLWNAHRISDDTRRRAGAREVLGQLLEAPLRRLGSPDPERDAVLVAAGCMARLEDFLWDRRRPARADVDHIVEFVLASVAGRKQSGRSA